MQEEKKTGKPTRPRNTTSHAPTTATLRKGWGSKRGRSDRRKKKGKIACKNVGKGNNAKKKKLVTLDRNAGGNCCTPGHENKLCPGPEIRQEVARMERSVLKTKSILQKTRNGRRLKKKKPYPTNWTKRLILEKEGSRRQSRDQLLYTQKGGGKIQKTLRGGGKGRPER